MMEHDEFLASLIGFQTFDATVVVERGPVEFFASAVFDEDPIYKDRTAATAAGYQNIPVPPTYPMVLRNWGMFEELQVAQEDRGLGIQGVTALLKERGGLILHGEQSFHMEHPVLVGDVLRGRGVIVEAYAKESKGHVMSFIVEETRWCDAETGEDVCSSRFNVIHRL